MKLIEKYALLLSKYELLVKVFEEVLVYVFATCEMRDLYRKKAGLPTKCEDDALYKNGRRLSMLPFLF